MPSIRARIQHYNRNGHENYVKWLISSCNEALRPYETSLNVQVLMYAVGNREGVDELLEKRISSLHLVLPEPEPEPEPEPVEEEVEEEPVVEIPEEEEVEEDDTEMVIEEDNDEDTLQEEIIVSPFENPFAEADYDSWTVAELRDECKARGITIRGTKAEVVLRLRRDDEGIVEQETESVSEAPVEETAVEETLDAPVEETAATEEVIEDDHSGQQRENNNEEE